ncbi:MAG: type II secretion system protein GspD, partial [Rikenellaceae bacterium]
MYRQEIDISTARIALPDLLQSIANANAVNVSVKGGENIVISSNFSRAKIVDLLYFVCSEYNLDIEVIGNIVSVYPYKPAPIKNPFIIKYDSQKGKLTYDLVNQNLVEVAKTISTKSGKNIIVPQTMYSKSVSGYLTGVEFTEAVTILAATNNLSIEEKQDNIWAFADDNSNASNKKNYVRRRAFPNEQLVIDSTGTITANIYSGNMYDIIIDICSKLNLNYHFIAPVNYHTSLFVSDVSLETLLNVMFAGTECGYYLENGIYMFGVQNDRQNMTSHEVFTMKYRTITDIVDIIPAAIKKDVQVQVFPDLNSIILSGGSKQVARVKEFLNSIDKSVPLVTMEIMIVDVTKGYVKEVGLDMGFGKKPATTGGTISPGVDMSFGASSINNLINRFNGFGNVNLGKVSNNFYINLKLLEEA